MKYTRISTDGEGESRFDDVDVALTSTPFAPPAPPLDTATPVATDRMILASAPPGWSGAWHPAPKRQFVLVLEGGVEIEVGDGEVRSFRAGSIVLLEDTTGQGHQTRTLDGGGATVAFVQLAESAE